MTKLITIVIPVWNREHLIERTLGSFAAQDCSRIKIIVVDNNSTDSTVDVVNRWKELHCDIDILLISEMTPGASAARNTGFRQVDTPYVMFFDSDDVVLPGHIKNIVERLDSDPSIEILGWDIDMELSSGRHKICSFVTDRLLFNHLVHATLATQRYVVSTQLVKESGEWNINLPGWNDYEFGVRLALNVKKVVKLFTKVPPVRTYFTEESITGRLFSANPLKWEHSLNTIESVLARDCPSALGWLGYRRAILAAEYSREGDSENAARLLRIAPNRLCGRWLVNVIYAVHRVFHRGSWILASCFLAKDFQNNETSF